jgi:hypothetical protein
MLPSPDGWTPPPTDTGTQQANETTKVVVRMAKVSIRVQSGAARFDVAVVADSEEQAISFVRKCYSTSDVRVRLLTGLAGFSVHGPVALTDDFSDALAA